MMSCEADPTLIAIDQCLEEKQEPENRPYLGASDIGNVCSRALWYQFRWFQRTRFKAEILKRFYDGQQGENLQAQRLRLLEKINLITHNAEGQQLSYYILNGHFGGHIDGLIGGLIQDPESWYIWEHKQVSETKFQSLKKIKERSLSQDTLKLWNTAYYAQAIAYMHLAGFEKHYLTCSTPGGRETISCITVANPIYAQALIQKAQKIVFAKFPPTQIAQEASYYLCRQCPFATICHGREAPQKNCRTCRFSQPLKKGGWNCKKNKQDLSHDQQLKGCTDYKTIKAGADAIFEEFYLS